MLILGLVLVGMLASGRVQAEAGIVDVAKLFFKRWTAESEQLHPKMLDYYSDSARILTMLIYGDKHKKEAVLTGNKWKTMIRGVIAATDSANDLSRYDNVSFEELDINTVKISATRYSLKKCYYDKGYYMIVQRMSGGAFGIVEESIEDHVDARCRK